MKEMTKDFDDRLLEMKRRRFIETVYRICNARNFPIPFVNFNGCPAETAGQEAHYQPDYNMICVSKRQIMKEALKGEIHLD